MLGELNFKDYFDLDKDDYLYNLKFKTIINNTIPERKKYHTVCNDKFRLICCDYVNKLKNCKLNTIKKKSLYSTVIIDNRSDPILEFMIRHMLIQLHHICSFYIVCFRSNLEYIKSICNSVSNNIHIIYFPNIHINSAKDYNKLLCSKFFWEHFKCDKILIYQVDSFLFNKKNIDKYFEYDYIGAPFYHKPNNLEFGNGGFSIRNVKLTKHILDTYPITRIMNEDLYFSQHFNNIKNCNLPSIKECLNFSLENIYSDKIDNYIGGHQFWFCLPNWEQYLKDILDKLYNQIPVEPSPLSPRVVESNDSTNSTINGDKSGETS